jgi:hypothetical protein
MATVRKLPGFGPKHGEWVSKVGRGPVVFPSMAKRPFSELRRVMIFYLGSVITGRVTERQHWQSSCPSRVALEESVWYLIG